MSDSHWSAPKVRSEVFLGHHWAVAAVSLCFITFRLGVRIKYFHKIWADDVLIIVAWLILCAAATLYQSQSVNLYNQYPLATGKIPPTLVNMARERTLLSSTLAQYFPFYTALWTVKLSILLFFRRLFGERQSAPWLKAWWWLSPPLPYVLGLIASVHSLSAVYYNSCPNCAQQEQINYTWINLQISCATDIVTEIMILSIPVIRLWNVEISFNKKLALLGILCLTVITILFAVIRIGVMPNKTARTDVTWICLWAHVEAGIAVIVACLASFRQLFVKSANSVPHKQSSYPASSTNFSLSRIKSPFSHIFRPLPKASSKVANLLSPLRNQPRTVESLSSHKLVDGPVPFDMTHTEEDFGASNTLNFGGMEKLAQKIYTSV
ncbi:hypothetical protein JMJ35_010131 [Cladonia borealis]|uniref:Rhodopsin domain-containing protein n=1 Tax=Cladonia borealis TaxID=184061 RepID=A0AA39QTT8_9LECA|nr:hypothetical protein JMJ35_010131 [Cladonia borealis]